MTKATFETIREEQGYALPDGTPVWSAAGEDGGTILYTRIEWESGTAADYEIQEDGRITFQGQPTGWMLTDLEEIDSQPWMTR